MNTDYRYLETKGHVHNIYSTLYKAKHPFEYMPTSKNVLCIKVPIHFDLMKMIP